MERYLYTLKNDLIYIRRAAYFSFRVISKIDKIGLKKTVEFAVRKFKRN